MSSIGATPRLRRLWLAAGFAAAGLAGCGGGGGNAGNSPFPSPTSSPGPAPSGAPAPSAPLEASSRYAAQCVQPRPADAVDPYTGEPYGDAYGSAWAEKRWVRAWIDETYLWWDEVPDVDATRYITAPSYFSALKTGQNTASGKPKDQFHFTYDTRAWTDLSIGGVEAGYGMQLVLLSPQPPRRFVVAYTDPGTPAAAQGVARGAEIVSVDGVEVAAGSDVATLNAGLFPQSAGETHRLVVLDAGSAVTRAIDLVSGHVAKQPVQNPKFFATANGRVGYLQFNDHIEIAEAPLVEAITRLRDVDRVSDLILDIRYNGGGLLSIASELAYMVAGGPRTAGKTFERLDFNTKNPFGLSPAERSMPFRETTQAVAASAGRALPTLGLGRLVVLTGAGTCSASESIINGLRGAGVQVIQIGETTCGKPYGFFPTDNCGTTYFAIQFKGVNALGYGDYADGFVPAGSGANGVPGCRVADDFAHPLGDASEARLAAALGYLATGACPAGGTGRESAQGARDGPSEPVPVRSPLRENRFLR